MQAQESHRAEGPHPTRAAEVTRCGEAERGRRPDEALKYSRRASRVPRRDKRRWLFVCVMAADERGICFGLRLFVGRRQKEMPVLRTTARGSGVLRSRKNREGGRRGGAWAGW